MFSVKRFLMVRLKKHFDWVLECMPRFVVVSFFQYDNHLLLKDYSVVKSFSWMNRYAYFYLLVDECGNRVGLFSVSFGAALLAMLLEELRFFHVEKVIVIGTAGALDRRLGGGDIVVPEVVLMKDAVSSCYLVGCDEVRPAERLLCASRGVLEDALLPVHYGKCASVVHPYRVLEYVEMFERDGVVAVDMEAATCFSVSEVLGIESVVVFVVSDVVCDDEWVPYFGSSVLSRRKWQLLGCAFRVFRDMS